MDLNGLRGFGGRAWTFLNDTLVRLPRLAILLVVFAVLYFILRIVLRRAERYLLRRAQEQAGLAREQEKRIQTISAILRKLITVLFWAVVLTVLLGELGVDIGPIIAAAGVLGLAVSFGAQSLVRDIISGIFILAENQVRIGDVAVVNGTGGLVEAINLRTIVLRDLAGTVHIFPNGTITTMANMTKDWSGYVFDLGVSYREDVDRVIDVIRRVADGLAADGQFRDKIMAPVEIFGLDSFGESSIVIKGRLKTLPIEQWTVGREFNRRIKAAFAEQGIEIPFPQRTLHLGDGLDPLRALARPRGGESGNDAKAGGPPSGSTPSAEG